MTSPFQESFDNFENLKFDSSELKEVLLDDWNDLDKNFYNDIQTVVTQYYFPWELLSLSEKLHINSENVSMIHLTIRSAKKNSRFSFSNRLLFKIQCLSQTWFDESESSFHQLPQYTTIYQHRSPSDKSCQGGGISIYIHDSLNFKSRMDLEIQKMPFYQRSIGLQMVISKLLTLF